MEPAQPDDIGSRRLRWSVQLFCRAEERAEVRPVSAKFRCRHQRYIDLQSGREKKNPRDSLPPGERTIGMTARLQVEVADHTEFLIEHSCPIVDDCIQRVPLGNPKGDIHIGPLIARAKSRRAGQSTRCDPWISLCQHEHARTNLIAELNRIHALPNPCANRLQPTATRRSPQTPAPPPVPASPRSIADRPPPLSPDRSNQIRRRSAPRDPKA